MKVSYDTDYAPAIGDLHYFMKAHTELNGFDPYLFVTLIRFDPFVPFSPFDL